MQKVMLVGAIGAGKTSLIHTLQKDVRSAEKTQSIQFSDGAIDTPGEYAQIPRFYSALMTTAMQASVVVVVQDATNLKVTLPPGFAGMFSRPVIGVVTKVDAPGIDRDKAKSRLMEIGVKEPIFFVSSRTGEGIEELIAHFGEGRCNS
ncbi:EutP/PduV family microcompartment system protein [Pelosinus propionicus]|nr:EutP/PduV family microcompartment system protein [Pelosinus propionicus]